MFTQIHYGTRVCLIFVFEYFFAFRTNPSHFEISGKNFIRIYSLVSFVISRPNFFWFPLVCEILNLPYIQDSFIDREAPWLPSIFSRKVYRENFAHPIHRVVGTFFL